MPFQSAQPWLREKASPPSLPPETPRLASNPVPPGGSYDPGPHTITPGGPGGRASRAASRSPLPRRYCRGGKEVCTPATPKLVSPAPNGAAGPARPAEDSASPPGTPRKVSPFSRAQFSNELKTPWGSGGSGLGAATSGAAPSARGAGAPPAPSGRLSPGDAGRGSPAPGSPRSSQAPLRGHHGRQTKRGRVWRTRRRLTSGPRSPGLAVGRRAASRRAGRRGALFGEGARAVRARPRAGAVCRAGGGVAAASAAPPLRLR